MYSHFVNTVLFAFVLLCLVFFSLGFTALAVILCSSVGAVYAGWLESVLLRG